MFDQPLNATSYCSRLTFVALLKGIQQNNALVSNDQWSIYRVSIYDINFTYYEVIFKTRAPFTQSFYILL